MRSTQAAGIGSLFFGGVAGGGRGGEWRWVAVLEDGPREHGGAHSVRTTEQRATQPSPGLGPLGLEGAPHVGCGA